MRRQRLCAAIETARLPPLADDVAVEFVDDFAGSQFDIAEPGFGIDCKLAQRRFLVIPRKRESIVILAPDLAWSGERIPRSARKRRRKQAALRSSCCGS